MSPTHASIELATPEHAEELLPLWRAARAEAGSSKEQIERPGQEERISLALADERVRIYLARNGGPAIGFVAAVTAPLSGLADVAGVWVDMLYVAPGARKRGVAHLLLGAAERFAESVHAEQVVILAPAQARDTNRFLARLGFGSRLALRVTSTEALRRRLCPGEEQARERLLARRRSLLRARQQRVLSGEQSA